MNEQFLVFVAIAETLLVDFVFWSGSDVDKGNAKYPGSIIRKYQMLIECIDQSIRIGNGNLLAMDSSRIPEMTKGAYISHDLKASLEKGLAEIKEMIKKQNE